MISASNPVQGELLVVEKHRDTRVLRKSNDEIGFRIKSGSLSLLARKILNLLVWHAQDQRGQEDEDGRWCVPIAQIIKDARFNSRDYDLLRESLDELQQVRVIRQARNGGVTCEVLIPSYRIDNVAHDGNEALERGKKKRGGALMLWYMLPPELKRQLLDPDQYTRLPVARMAALKSTPGLVLYEICRRYATNPSGVTNRDSWQNWWRVMTGASPDKVPPEYKYAKRDVFKRGVDEVNRVTDVDVEMIEFKSGRFVHDLQFAVRMKQQSILVSPPSPVDTGLISKIMAMGIHQAGAERIIGRYSEKQIEATIELVKARAENRNLPPLDSLAAFFKKALRENYVGSKNVDIDAMKLKKEDASAKMVAMVAAENLRQEQQRKARKDAMDRFNQMSPVKRNNILERFAETLKGPALRAYLRDGLESPLTGPAFAGWLASINSADLD